MDDGLLDALQAAADDDVALQALIKKRRLGIETVEALKAHSADFFFSDPAEAMRVAHIACRLGALLPEPASTLG